MEQLANPAVASAAAIVIAAICLVCKQKEGEQDKECRSAQWLPMILPVAAAGRPGWLYRDCHDAERGQWLHLSQMFLCETRSLGRIYASLPLLLGCVV